MFHWFFVQKIICLYSPSSSFFFFLLCNKRTKMKGLKKATKNNFSSISSTTPTYTSPLQVLSPLCYPSKLKKVDRIFDAAVAFFLFFLKNLKMLQTVLVEEEMTMTVNAERNTFSLKIIFYIPESSLSFLPPTYRHFCAIGHAITKIP